MIDSDSPAVRPAAAAQAFAGTAMSKRQTGLLLLGLGLATGMEFYTVDSVNLALPDLTGTLGVSGDEASWLLTVYSCSLFLGVPVSIWLAEHVGYKRFLISTTIAFALTSAACALSANLPSMLVWRALQGAAGAGLVIWWRASVYVIMPTPTRGAALMRVSTPLYLSSAAGLLISGYLTDHYDWRMIFLPNLVYAGAAVWLLLRYFPALPSAPSIRAVRTDGWGISFLAVALISLQIILSRGEIDDWFGSSRIRFLGCLSAAALLCFVWWQASPHNRAPLLRLELLRNRLAMSSALIGVFTGMILSGSLFVLPRYLRNFAAAPLSATQTGQIMCVYALTAAAMRPSVVRLIARLGQRKVIGGSLISLIASMVLFNRLLTSGTPEGYYVLPLILYALCVSHLLTAVSSATVGKIEQSKLLDGVSLYMTFRQFGASLGVAVLTILLSRRETLHSSRLFEHLRHDNPLTQNWLGVAVSALRARGGLTSLEASQPATALLAHTGAQQTATLSYADGFAFMALIGFVALCLVPIVPPTPPLKK
jgi:MFS transporter, DHA2 family, multidrug resistance protein